MNVTNIKLQINFDWCSQKQYKTSVTIIIPQDIIDRQSFDHICRKWQYSHGSKRLAEMVSHYALWCAKQVDVETSRAIMYCYKHNLYVWRQSTVVIFAFRNVILFIVRFYYLQLQLLFSLIAFTLLMFLSNLLFKTCIYVNIQFYVQVNKVIW